MTARRHRLEIVGAVTGAVVALVLLVLAVDVLRWQSALGAGDASFEATPRTAGHRWAVDGIVPSALAKAAFRVEDDLAYRVAIQQFARVEPGEVQIYGPRLENLFSTAQVSIGRVSRDDPEPARRSRALNITGVFQVGRPSQVTDAAERAAVLRLAIGLFQGAVRLDEHNDDAKLNLELSLRDAGAAVLAGDVPAGQAAQGERAGAGRAGGGY